MVNKGLSKSKYTKFRQCDKALWLRVYHPELAIEDPQMAARFQMAASGSDKSPTATLQCISLAIMLR